MRFDYSYSIWVHKITISRRRKPLRVRFHQRHSIRYVGAADHRRSAAIVVRYKLIKCIFFFRRFLNDRTRRPDRPRLPTSDYVKRINIFDRTERISPARFPTYSLIMYWNINGLFFSLYLSLFSRRYFWYHSYGSGVYRRSFVRRYWRFSAYDVRH